MSASRSLVLVGTPSATLYSEDAEQAVLGAMLLDADAIVRAVELVDETMFYREAHRRMFRAMLSLHQQGGVLDPLTLANELEKQGGLAAAGGKDYIGTLLDVVPTAANVEYHLKIVKEKALRRRLIEVAYGLVTEAEDHSTNPALLAASVQCTLAHLEQVTSGGSVFPVVRLLDDDAPPAPTLLVEDLILAGEVNLWAGFGGSAKSVTALHLAICVALGRPVFGTLAVHRSGPVLIVAPEDGQGAVRMMLDSIIAGMGLDADARATLAEWLVMIPDDTAVSLVRDSAKLGQTARAHGAVLVVLDPLRNLLGGADILDNVVANDCCEALRRDVCRGAGAAVLLNTHNRKPGRDSVSTASTRHDLLGAGGWVDGARLVFGVSNKGGEITLECLKSNRIRADLRHELRLTIDADPAMRSHWRSCTITDRNAGASSESLAPGVGRAVNTNERAALMCLDDQHEPGKRLSWSRWRDGSGLNENTFKSVKDRLLHAALAVAISTGHKTRAGGTEHGYALTNAGRLALSSGWVTARSNGEGVSNGE